MRLARSGSPRTVTAMIAPNSTLVSRSAATIAIGASAGTDFGGQPVVVDLRNFSVTGDDPVCPPGARP